jgi:hypothetical protein
MTNRPAHVSACKLVAGAIGALLLQGEYVREQNPWRIPDYVGNRGKVHFDPDREWDGFA